MSSSIRRRSAATLSQIFVFLLFMRPSLATEKESLCNRFASDKDTNPSFLCQYNVTFERKSDCSAFINETMVFPHTTGEFAYRSIPVLSDFQEISDVEVRRDGLWVFFSIHDDESNVRRVVMSTVKSADPTVFELRYRLSNAVMQFTKTCGSTGDQDGNKNIMRWKSGDWQKSFDLLFVRFLTEDKNAKLSLLGENGSRSKEVSVLKRNVDENVELYAEESGVSICQNELECFDVQSPGEPIRFDIFWAILILILACLIIVGAFYSTSPWACGKGGAVGGFAGGDFGVGGAGAGVGGGGGGGGG